MTLLSALITPFAAAFMISLSLTGLIAWISHKFELMSPVREERWHKKPKPHMGGIAIFAAFVLASLFSGNFTEQNRIIFLGAAGMFVLGLLDDLFDLKPYIKLIYQIAIAAMVSKFGISVAAVSDQLLAMSITVVWIVMITNAFNLLDNMDGLSGGIAIISMLSFLFIACLNGRTDLILPAAIIIGAIAGFLVLNFPPAKIFMGDCGSLLIGFLLASYAIQGTWQQASNLFLLLMTPVLLLGVPIFDTLVVSVQRIMHGRPFYEGGKDHTSHRLVAHGWSEKQAILILYGVAVLLGGITVLGYAINSFVASQVVLLIVVFLFVLALFLSDVKMYKDSDPTKESETAPAVGVEAKKNTAVVVVPYLLHKRRIVEIIIDSILIVVAYISAYLLRYDGVISIFNWSLIQQSLPIILAMKLVAMLVSGMYSGIWQYINFSDLRRIFLSVVMASLTSVCMIVGLYRFSGFSRSLFFIDFILFLFLVIGFRVVLRVLRESIYGFSKSGANVLIVGAGEAGQWVLNEIRKDRSKRLVPVGLIDDDGWKIGRKIFGVVVLGGRQDIVRAAREKNAKEIIIAIPSATAAQRQELLNICQQTGLPVRVFDAITQLTWSPASPQASGPDGSGSIRNDSSTDQPSPFDQRKLH